MHLAQVQFASTAKPAGGGVLTSKKTDAHAAQKSMVHGAVGNETQMDLAVQEAKDVWKKSGRKRAAKVLLVMSDGLPSGGTASGSKADLAFRAAIEAGAKVLFVLIGGNFRWMQLPRARL